MSGNGSYIDWQAWWACAQARFLRSGGHGSSVPLLRLLNGYTAAAAAIRKPIGAEEKRRFNRSLRRNIKAKLAPVGLRWVNFQVLRRTQASLSQDLKVDPKVAADQRGHTLGVAMGTYITTNNQSRLEAVTTLETELRNSEGAPGPVAAAPKGK